MLEGSGPRRGGDPLAPGISLIVKAHNEALDRDVKAVVLRPSPAPLRVLELCNLTHGLHIRTA